MARFTTDDGPEWRAVESSTLFEHAKAAGCLHQAHLRHELTERLGVRFQPATNGYAEIDGVPDAVINVFSKRRNEIEEELAATGRTSARSAQVGDCQSFGVSGLAGSWCWLVGWSVGRSGSRRVSLRR